jgi:hypothetical protein
MSAGWIIGFAIGALVVVVVVLLLTLMILGARAAASKAEAILVALGEARDNTQGLWQLRDTNATAARIVDGAVAARESLEGGGR